MADDALRVLGVAYRPVAEVPEKAEAEQLEHELIFVGLIGMIDPPSRPEVKPALAAAQTAGVRSVMITGDFPQHRTRYCSRHWSVATRSPSAHRHGTG